MRANSGPTSVNNHTYKNLEYIQNIRVYKHTYLKEYLGIPQADTRLFRRSPSSHMGMLFHSEFLGESCPNFESSETVVVLLEESAPPLLTPLHATAAAAVSFWAEMDFCDCIRLHLLRQILAQQSATIPTTNPNANPVAMPITKSHVIDFDSIV